MKPVEFVGQNVVLQKPPGMTDEECGSLPILRDLQSGYCISCWQPSWRERVKIFFRGKIWLMVLSGATQPPVAITAEQPFKIKEPGR